MNDKQSSRELFEKIQTSKIFDKIIPKKEQEPSIVNNLKTLLKATANFHRHEDLEQNIAELYAYLGEETISKSNEDLKNIILITKNNIAQEILSKIRTGLQIYNGYLVNQTILDRMTQRLEYARKAQREIDPEELKMVYTLKDELDKAVFSGLVNYNSWFSRSGRSKFAELTRYMTRDEYLNTNSQNIDLINDQTGKAKKLLKKYVYEHASLNSRGLQPNLANQLNPNLTTQIDNYAHAYLKNNLDIIFDSSKAYDLEMNLSSLEKKAHEECASYAKIFQNFAKNINFTPTPSLSSDQIRALYETINAINPLIKPLYEEIFSYYFSKPVKVFDIFTADQGKSFDELLKSKSLDLPFKDFVAYLNNFKPLSDAQFNLKEELIKFIHFDQEDIERFKPHLLYLTQSLYQAKAEGNDKALIMAANAVFIKVENQKGNFDNALKAIKNFTSQYKRNFELGNFLCLTKSNDKYHFNASANTKDLTANQHLQKYAHLIEKFNVADENCEIQFSNLMLAYKHLALSGIMGDEAAGQILHKDQKLILTDEAKISKQIYAQHLETIVKDSPLYKDAQMQLALLNCGRRYQKIYNNYEDRVKDLYSTFTHLANTEGPVAETIRKRLNLDDTANLQAISLKLLLLELIGQDPLGALFPNNDRQSNNPYPFKVSKANIEGLLTEILKNDSDKETLKTFYLDKYQRFIQQQFKTFNAIRNQNSYQLEISKDDITNLTQPILFTDPDSSDEVVRIYCKDGVIHVDGLENNICVNLSDNLEGGDYVFDSADADIQLHANFNAQSNINIVVHAKNFDFNGAIHASDSINIESTAKINFSKDTILDCAKQLHINAEALQNAGTLQADSLGIMLDKDFLTTDDSKILGNKELMITSKGDNTLNGVLVSSGDLSFITQGHVNQLSGKIEGNSVHLSGKSMHVATNTKLKTKYANLSFTDIDIDKKVSWQAKDISISAENINNYSEALSFEKADINAQHRFTNFKDAVIKTEKSLKLTGDQALNQGKIFYGDNLYANLRQSLTNGASTEEELQQLIKAKKEPEAQIIGKDATILTTTCANLYGKFKTYDLSLTAMTDINAGFYETKNATRKQALNIDIGYNTMNLEACSHDLYRYFISVRYHKYQREFAKELNPNLVQEDDGYESRKAQAMLPTVTYESIDDYRSDKTLAANIKNSALHTYATYSSENAINIIDTFKTAKMEQCNIFADTHLTIGEKMEHSGFDSAIHNYSYVNDRVESGTINAKYLSWHNKHLKTTEKSIIKANDAIIKSLDASFAGKQQVSRLILDVSQLEFLRSARSNIANLFILADNSLLDGTFFANTIRAHSAQSTTLAGELNVTDTLHLESENLTTTSSSKINNPGTTTLVGRESIDSKADINVGHLNMNTKRLTLSEKIRLKRGEISASIVTQQADVKFKDSLDFKTDHLEMAPGSKTAGDGQLSIDSHTAKLHDIDAKQLRLKLDHVPYIEDLFLHRGIYSTIQARDTLDVSTQDPLILSNNMVLPISLIVRAPSFKITGDIYSQKNLGFIANKGSIETLKNKIAANNKLLFEAKQEYRNIQGTISGGDATYIKTGGDFINYAGTIFSPTVVKVFSGGNIINTVHCLPTGDLRNPVIYTPGHIYGGTGDEKGFGLYLVAGNKICNDASEIYTIGGNYVDAKLGVESTPRLHQYLSYHKEWDNPFGHKETNEYQYHVQKPMIYSLGGKNIFRSKKGGFYSVSSDLFAKDGNDIYASGNIDLLGLKTETVCEKRSDMLYGFNRVKERNEYNVPTYVVDYGNTRIHSENDINILNANLIGSGDLYLLANNVTVSQPKLAHSYEQRSLGFEFKLPDLSMVPGYSVYLDAKEYRNANNNVERVATLWNAGVDTVNTFNDAITVYRNILAGASVLKSLSGLCAPTVELGCTFSHTKSYAETLPENTGIHRGGSLFVKTNGTLAFLNGVPVYIMGDAVIDSPRFIQQGAALISSNESDSVGATVGVGFNGFNGGVNASLAKSRQMQYANQRFHVGGKLSTNIRDWQMTAANTHAKRWVGKVGNLSIVTPLNESHGYSASTEATTAGRGNFNYSRHSAKTIGTPSGISVESDLNTPDAPLHVDKTYLEGAKILSGGVNNYATDTLVTKDVKETKKANNVGISGNFGKKCSQAIRTVDTKLGVTDIAGTQQSTIFGAKGTQPKIKKLEGNLNTADANGYKSLRNVKYNVHLKVPFPEKEGIERLKDNIRWLQGEGQQKLQEMPNARKLDARKTKSKGNDTSKADSKNANENENENANERKDGNSKDDALKNPKLDFNLKNKFKSKFSHDELPANNAETEKEDRSIKSDLKLTAAKSKVKPSLPFSKLVYCPKGTYNENNDQKKDFTSRMTLWNQSKKKDWNTVIDTKDQQGSHASKPTSVWRRGNTFKLLNAMGINMENAITRERTPLFPESWHVGTRTIGGLQVVGGTIQIVTSGGLAYVTAPTVVGPVFFTTAAASGFDNAVTGVKQMYTGKPQHTYFASAMKHIGVDPNKAAIAQGVFDFATTLQGGGALKFPVVTASFFAKSNHAALRQRVLESIANSKAARANSNYQLFDRKANAIDYYAKSGFTSEEAASHMRGIDFFNPVVVVTLPRNSLVVQYLIPGRKVGNYFAPLGTPGSKLGIYTSGRMPVFFEAKKEMNVLKSTAASMTDDYSMAAYGWKIQTEGGGVQYFSSYPNLWRMKS